MMLARLEWTSSRSMSAHAAPTYHLGRRAALQASSTEAMFRQYPRRGEVNPMQNALYAYRGEADQRKARASIEFAVF